MEHLFKRGPDSNESPNEHEVQPEEIHLSGGDPLYYVFLPKDSLEMGVIKPQDSQQAHAHLRDLFAANRDLVLSCEGKSPEEARAMLDTIVIPPVQQVA